MDVAGRVPQTPHRSMQTCAPASRRHSRGERHDWAVGEALVERKSSASSAIAPSSTPRTTGVNLMFRINKQLAALMTRFEGMGGGGGDHHRHYISWRSSGTAITIAEGSSRISMALRVG